jgi:WD40 repeat protein
MRFCLKAGWCAPSNFSRLLSISAACVIVVIGLPFGVAFVHYLASTHLATFLQTAKLQTIVSLLLLNTGTGLAQTAEVLTFSWSPSGRYMAISYTDGVLKVKDMSDGGVIFEKKVQEYGGWIIAWKDDESSLATVSPREFVIVNIQNGDQRIILDHGKSIMAVVWAPKSNLIYTGAAGFDEAKAIRVWNRLDGSLVYSNEIGLVGTIAFSPEGNFVAIWNRDEVKVFTPDFSQSMASSNDADSQKGYATAMRWGNNNHIITGHISGLVQIWDTSKIITDGNVNSLLKFRGSDDPTPNDLIPDAPRIFDIAFSPDGDKVSSVAADGTLRTWDANSGQLLNDQQMGAISIAAFSPDGAELAYIVPSSDEVQIIPAPLVTPTPTATLVPTSTPTATFTPTATATFTPTLVIPPSFAKLRLTSMCSADPALTRRWRVRNSNAFPLPFTWEIYGNGQAGSGVAVAGGDVFFESNTVNGANTLRLFVGGKLQEVKASGGARCP